MFTSSLAISKYQMVTIVLSMGFYGVLFFAGDRLACQLSVPVAWMPCFGTLRLAQLDQIILQNHLWSHSFLGISLIFLDLVHWFHEFEEKSTGHPSSFSDFYTQVSTDLSGTKRPDCDGKPGWQWLIIIFPHIFFMKKMWVFGCFWLISCGKSYFWAAFRQVR